MLVPLSGRMIVRGLFEANPFPLDSVGEFDLVWLSAAPVTLAVSGKDGATTQSGGGTTIPLVDGDGLALGKMKVLQSYPGKANPFFDGPPETPILICANPYIVPTRAPSTQRIDPTTPSTATTRFAADEFRLVWSDEFNGTALDQTRWTSRTPQGDHPETWTGEAGFPYGNVFSPDNVAVQGGRLRLSARFVETTVASLPSRYKWNVNYTNGGIESRYKADFRYGKIVVKTRVPNVPFMHHGVWAYSSENGAPGLEVDFPDAANSPIAANGNDKTAPTFAYTYLNNSHPRMAMAVIGNNGALSDPSTARGDVSCAARPDPTNVLRLDQYNEREYWMEWDRDDQGGYIKVGVTPINPDGTPDESRSQTAQWWGLKNHKNPNKSSEYYGAQFIPDQDRPVFFTTTTGTREVENNNQTLGRFNSARQSEPPFNRFSTWFYDYFPMNIQLDMQSFNTWAGGYCIPSNGNVLPGSVLASTCATLLQEMKTALTGNGQTVEVDYVRVYQRDRSANRFKPLILNGEKFTSGSLVRLYRTAALSSAFRTLETRPWNQTELVAMITQNDQDFLNGENHGFVRVVNFQQYGGGTPAISNPKRITFGTTEQASVRANRFSHRYVDTKPNPDASSPSLVIQEGTDKPKKPFSWVGTYDQLNIDLYNLPSLGGTASTTATTPPPAFTSLTRIPTARAKWDVQVLNAAGQALGLLQAFPAGATNVNISTVWRPEGTSQYRSGVSEGQYRAVRLTEADPVTNNLVTAMGRYPSCADLLEVTALITSLPTAPTDQFDPVNMCGPFTIRYYLDPKPQAAITSSTVTSTNSTLVATVGIQVQTTATMGNMNNASYVWEREILENNGGVYTVASPWTAIATGATLTGIFVEQGLTDKDIIRIRCRITSNNTLWDCPTMSSSTAQIIVLEPQAPPPNNSTLLNKSGEISSLSAVNANASANQQPIAGEDIPQPTKIHTVDLLTAPNPAETQVGLRFRLPDDATVTVEVVDALQRVVLNPLAAEVRLGGDHELVIPVGSLPSGAYSVRLRAALANGRTLVQQRALIIAR